MRQSVRVVFDEWNADLVVVGLVKKPGEVLSLWFVPRSGKGTLSRGDQPYRLEDVTLGKDFHMDLRAQLTTLALTAVAPLADNEVRGQVLEKGLWDATARLSILLKGATIDNPEHRADLHVAFGNALHTLGERERGTERLEDAVEAYREALKKHTRKRVPLDWGHDAEQPRQRPLDPGRARARHRASREVHRGLPRSAQGTHPRARAARLGHDAEQPRQRPTDPGRARARHRASREVHRGLPRSAQGIYPRARAARLGRDAEQPRRRPTDPGRARARHRASREVHRGLPRSAQGTHPRACRRSIGPGRRTTSATPYGPWARASAAPSVSRSPSRPTAKRSRSTPASACRSSGP